MNNNDLWNAMGDIGTDIVLEAESAPKRSHKKRTAIVLAAAMLVLFSVTALATEFFTSFEHLYVLVDRDKENYEQPIGTEAYSEETGVRFTALSSLADERLCLIFWQAENTNGDFVERSHVTTDVSVNGRARDHHVLWGPNDPENILKGYEVIQTYGGKHLEGTLTLKDIYYIELTGEVDEESGFPIGRSVVYLENDLSVDFTVDKFMESIELKTKDPNIKIICSPISMVIEGDLPEYESMDITLEKGSTNIVEKYNAYSNFFYFSIPFDPEKVVSVLYNGEELLK